MEGKDLKYCDALVIPYCCSLTLIYGLNTYGRFSVEELLNKDYSETRWGVGMNYCIITNDYQTSRHKKALASLGFKAQGKFPSVHSPYSPCTLWIHVGVNNGKKTNRT